MILAYVLSESVPQSTTAGIVAAWAAVITAIGGIVLAIGVLLPILKATREVHTIVNQQRTDMQRYTAALIKALEAAGIEVPDDQSKLDP